MHPPPPRAFSYQTVRKESREEELLCRGVEATYPVPGDESRDTERSPHMESMSILLANCTSTNVRK